MKVAAIYARVSSQRQKQQDTIDSQTSALLDYAKNNGYAIPSEWIFEDEGYSGSNLVRPGLERLRDLAAEGQLEAVIIYSPDRLSRKYAYQVVLTEEFSRCGVEVVFLRSPQGGSPEDQLVVQFQGMIAEYERAQLGERSRRGKRYRAQNGSVNVFSRAPYGYRYVPKNEDSAAFYEVVENEAQTVRLIYRLYTEGQLSMAEIARRLTQQKLPTRHRASRWSRSTVWAMLRNPAYIGKACYGKTRNSDRTKVTRRSRQRGGFSLGRSSQANPREEWIEVPVPALIDEETFDRAQERLEENKRFAARRTVEPTLLQGLLVCKECGYAFNRSSATTSKRKIHYYRCSGTDNYRFANGRVCQNRPVRQDYLDGVVWKQVIQLLGDPQLIRAEIDRRIRELRDSSPTKHKKSELNRERTRVQKTIDKLLDVYQEGLMELEELRQRLPELRQREKTLVRELHRLESGENEQANYAQLADNVQGFLARLHSSADTLSIADRQRVVRLLVKEVLIGADAIHVKHSIPARTNPSSGSPSPTGYTPNYLLRSGRQDVESHRQW